jgi:ABC-type nitrate/sulfonate/bicarbonate transport system substrate-binding protein
MFIAIGAKLDPDSSKSEIIQPSNQPSPLVENPKQNRKPLLVMLIVGLTLLIAGSLTWLLIAKSTDDNKDKQYQKYSGPVENITIGNVGEYSIFNLIAKEKGYFREYGLNAEIKEYASGPPAVTDLLAGKVDFAIAADFVGVNNIFTSPKLRILSQVSQQDAFRIIARKDKGITEPIDLKNKRIAVTFKGAGDFFLIRFLNLNGISVEDVTKINATPAEMNNQITNSEVDAIVIFEPHAYNIEKALGDGVVSWSAQGNLKTLALSYSTEEYINEHPDIVRRYLGALVEAENFLRQNDQAAREILAKVLTYDRAYVDHLWPKIEFKLSLEQGLLLNLEDEARFVIDSGATNQTKVPNYLDYIYFEGLEAVKAAGVNVVH